MTIFAGTFTASVATAPDCVVGDYCDVMVLEDEIVGYHLDESGDEIPVCGAGSTEVMPCVETDVLCSDEDVIEKAGMAADDILLSAGWRRTEDWAVTDVAMYAAVERI